MSTMVEISEIQVLKFSFVGFETVDGHKDHCSIFPRKTTGISSDESCNFNNDNGLKTDGETYFDSSAERRKLCWMLCTM